VDGEDGKSIADVSTADALDPITNEVIGTEITFLDEDNNPVGSPVTVLNGVDGVVDPKNLTADDNSITVTNGVGATMIDASVKVTDGGITTAKIADGAVTTAKIQGDGNDKVLTTDASGNPVWIDKDDFDAIEPWNVQGTS